MPGLIVSVRSADEARIALENGADLIDVKEPSRGALGR
ncbi:MAG: (5-formylfuran-3-yl)methyl phosphate synthase, partial [Gemmataceae bacterium]|nr:(5-formylfuran-3-yl)methyl phosphate synthase [Gemmataceae bacterium]